MFARHEEGFRPFGQLGGFGKNAGTTKRFGRLKPHPSALKAQMQEEVAKAKKAAADMEK